MLNDNQFDRLAAYEKYMKTALDSNYPRSPGPRALREIHAVVREVDPLHPTLNTTCGTCILRLLKKAGRYYFEKKAAMDLERAEAVKVTLEAVGCDETLRAVGDMKEQNAALAKAVKATKKAPAKSGTKSTKKPAKK